MSKLIKSKPKKLRLKLYKIQVSNIYEIIDLETFSKFKNGCSNKEILAVIEFVRIRLKLKTPIKTLNKWVFKAMGVHTVSEIEGITVSPFRDVYHAMDLVFFNRKSFSF